MNISQIDGEFFMQEFERKSPYMDYRNSVPFMNLSGFVVRQENAIDEIPAMSLSQHLLKKKMSCMINLRRLKYCVMSGAYRNGRI